MFRKIALTYNESPASRRALVSAIQLAKSLNTELHTVTVMTGLPAYTAYAAAADASLSKMLMNDRVTFYKTLQDEAGAIALQEGIKLTSHLIEGGEVDAIVHFVREQKVDLLVIGLHQRDLYVAPMEYCLRTRARSALQCSWRSLESVAMTVIFHPKPNASGRTINLFRCGESTAACRNRLS